MEISKLSEYSKGWLVGDFEPSLVRAKNLEFAVKHYAAGSEDCTHCHKIAVEITVIVYGRARFNDITVDAGDIVRIEPGEYTKFKAIEDCGIAVIKAPSIVGDKYTL
jgi:hypothetical protein